MPYATLQNVVDRLGRPLTSEESTLGELLLSDVEMDIKQRIADLDALVTDETIPVENVVRVEASAVVRVLKNPEGYRYEQDGDYSYSLNAQVASGLLTITDREWSLLGVSASAFTITPYLDPCRGFPQPDPWVIS